MRKSVYDSRIEQILYENPEMPILITDAGKNHEGGGSYIVYTIRTGVSPIQFRQFHDDDLTPDRTWKSGGATPNLRRCDRPL